MWKLYFMCGLAIATLTAFVAFWRFLDKKRKMRVGVQVPQPVVPESEELDLAIHDAEARLSAAKLNRAARIGDLPIFLLIGDPETAKTSTMLHSGLEPELLAGQVFQNNDVISTPGINIWFAAQAVFVEAGGRFSLQVNSWHRLLRKLAQRGLALRKGGQAPRAVIVFFDCRNLIRPDALEVAASAGRNLRIRLGEISQTMGIDLPVYVLFTKLDCLPCFPEYVSNFSSDETHQVFGETLPMLADRSAGIYAEAATRRMTDHFERLFRSLADGRAEFLNREADSAKLPATYEFPREFRKIRPAAVQFLVDLCRPSHLTTGPFLRGFYFSGTRSVTISESARARTTSPELEFDSVSRATQIFRREIPVQARPVASLEAETAGSRKVQQWMFLSRLFHDVLLADRTVQGAGGVSMQTSTIRRLLLGAATLLCLLLSIALTTSFFCNRSLETRVLDAAVGISSSEPTNQVPSVEVLRKLEVLRESLETLASYRRAGAPWRYRWGLYAGDELYSGTRQLYFAHFRQILFRSTQGAILENLRNLPAAPGPEYGPTYGLLKAYLITTSNHDKSTRAFLSPVLLKAWTDGGSVDLERRALAQKQFDFYSDELKSENPFSEENDLAAVEKARRYLGQFAGAERVYALMTAEAAKNASPVNFSRAFPWATPIVVETHEVGAAFTKAGWSFMEGALHRPDRYFNGEKWVLGERITAQADLAGLERDLRNRYLADFLREWRLYIQSASVTPYTDAKDAAAKLRSLSSNQSPLLALLSLASQHTAVDDPAVSAVFQPAQAVVPPGSTDRYIAEPNQNYINALSTLQVALENSTGQPDDPAAAQILNSALQAKLVTRRMAQGFRLDKDGHVDAAVQKLLEDPILLVEQTLRGAVPAELNAGGKALCSQFRTLTSKFPFNPKAKVDAVAADVSAVFRKPDGALWSWYEKGLNKVLTKQGARYASSGAVSLNPAFVNFFNEAAALSYTLYAPGATDPAFTYTVKPGISDGVQGITLRVDGQTLTYSLGNPIVEKTFTWHASEPHDLTASVRIGSSEFEWLHQPGPWGIFRFLTVSKHWEGRTLEWPVGAGGAQFNTDGKPVTVRLEVGIEPMATFFRSGLTCVSEVAQ